ncbi:MAG TPA: glycosyltransferase [Bryobacteraceae bacterium]|nr:glycosyltransferase [Bryobacteraceae bacterium]
MRGGEQVVEAICRLVPNADVFTMFYDPNRVSPLIRSRVVKASFLNPLRRHYRSLLPLFPMALESLDLRGYDLVISSESGPAKGVLTSSTTRHVCYCHSPMRYLWELYPAYLHDWTRPAWKRGLMAALAWPLRVWDFAAAARVDEFLANSRNVQRRIWKTYRRESQVIYPPVAVESCYWKPAAEYYLIVAELVAYKRVFDAVRFFSRTGRRLKIVGEGPEYAFLKRHAGASVEFCGKVSSEELRALYSRCRALLMPGEEDFGMVAVEAMASGKAVIALGRGGVLESVPAGDVHGGVFYEDPGEAGLEEAVNRFEELESFVLPAKLQSWAARFSEARFREEMRQVIGLEGAESDKAKLPARMPA